MASSSPIPPKEKYDVFISFRGLDTRKTFTSHLHAALIRRKIDTYIDYRLEKGEELEPALLKAIEESKIYVVIFSEDYAFSTWCLKELAYVMDCEGRGGRYVIPVFYGIDPSDVRKQTGSYATAFAEHEKRLGLTDEVLKWKGALTKAANRAGCDPTSKTFRDDSDLVEQVVRDVFTKLNRDSTTNVPDNLVGVGARIESIVRELDITADDVRVRFVVIWGMGGIGKTTLATAVFHGLSSQFEASCFLANVRELSGAKQNFSPQLKDLRNELLRKLLGDGNLDIQAPFLDSYVKDRLNRTKVLVVLDDVNHSRQLEFLAGGEVPFGPGSRIIITTRDLQPVKEMQGPREVVGRDVKTYQVKELDDAESMKFFLSSTPRDLTPNSKFLDGVLRYAAGVPLAIKVLSGQFLRCKSQEELEMLWKKLRKFPDEDLQNVYRASFDGLKRNEREIFLDIACLYKGEDIHEVKSILATRGLFPDDGIRILIDMSLISIKTIKDNDYDCIWMHDVIQEMGVDIVKEECADERGNRSRLHKYKDVIHVLKNNTGTSKTHSIHVGNLYLYGKESTIDFRLMRNLRFLTIGGYTITHPESVSLPNTLKYLRWDHYLSKSLLSNFSPENLVELHMRFSKLQSLWNEDQNLVNLKIIDLAYSTELVEVAFLSNCVNIERINLAGCRSVQFPDLTKCVNIKSINLRNLTFVQVPVDLSNSVHIESIDLGGCEDLATIPLYFENFKLTYLNLNGCSRISFPPKKPSDLSTQYIISKPNKLRGCSGITTISIECMTELISVDLQHCWFFVSLPTNICKLKSLKSLILSGCIIFRVFPDILEPMESLKHLSLSGTGIEALPSSFGNLVGLKRLNLSFCSRLRLLPDSIYKLNRLTSLDLSYCTDLQEFPDCFYNWPALESLALSGTKIKTIHPTIRQVSGLKSLFLNDCKHLQSLPELPSLLEVLKASGCTSLTTVLVSVTSPTQGLGQICMRRWETHSFTGCLNLDTSARSNIMDDAHHRIIRMATARNLGYISLGRIKVICSETEIPKWFSCQTEGSSMNIKLPLHWFDSNLLGIALCIVTGTVGRHDRDMHYLYKMIFKTKDGEGRHSMINDVLSNHFGGGMIMWYDVVAAVSDEAKEYTDVYFELQPTGFYQRSKVKRFGVCFLYPQGQDDNALKFEVIHPQQVKRRLIDDEASGSQVPDEFESNETDTDFDD